MKSVAVKEVAFGRTGDKGNVSNVFVIPYRGNDYELLLDTLTVERVCEAYADLVDGEITRYEFPGVKGINFVMEDALEGGNTLSLNLDGLGKSRAALLLNAEIPVPDEYEPPATTNGSKEWSR